MLKRLGATMVHFVGLGLVCAAAAYWVIKIITPQPTSAPPPLAPLPPREPDPVLAARLFGLVQTARPAVVAANIQVVGLFAAGSDSAAVLAVDGKPPRAYVIGQEVAPGAMLVEVTAEAAILEGPAGRQELRAPPVPVASLDMAPAAPAFTRQGNTLSAPGSSAAPAVRPMTPPQFAPPPPLNPQQQFAPPAPPPEPPPGPEGQPRPTATQ
jgi:general secretion pathway protein C